MEYKELLNQYGGYWNIDNILDYNFLVNPYFPNRSIIREIKKMSKKLIVNYPSGMNRLCELASNMFNVKREHIVVGNGAAELISHICNMLEGTTGVIKPSFNEYSARIKDKIEFCSTEYTVHDIMRYFDGKIRNLVIVNPQLHTGRYLCDRDIVDLIDWCKVRGISLIIDESFIDFADSRHICNVENIYRYEKLFIIKSLSKSYGIPGIRLGIVASTNEKMEYLKSVLPIWNISSFSEYFLDLIMRHQSEFIRSIDKINKERDRFKKDLDKINNIVITESFANYFLVRLIGVDANELCLKMFDKNVIMRDLSERLNGNFIRISVRSKRDNKKFLRKLKKSLEELGDGY